MFRTVLAAIDFSGPASSAARWVAAEFPDARLVLAHALEEVSVPGYIRMAVSDSAGLDLAEERELDARTNLDQVAEELGHDVEAIVRRGRAPAVLRDLVRETGAELVVVGAHLRRVWPWEEPGRTAEAIVESSEVPVLTWRPEIPDGERTVVALLDLREGSRPVAEAAAEAASHLGARLVVQHVITAAYQGSIRSVSSAVKAEEAARRVEASAREAALRCVPEAARRELDVRVVVSRGRPITQILAVSEQEAADLMVLGRSHLPGGRAGRALLGSVAAKVVRGAKCAVLTVPI